MQYYLFPTIAFIAFIIEKSKIKNAHRMYSILLFLLIIGISLLGSLRGVGIGTDYYVYLSFFENPFVLWVEPGIDFLSILVKSIGGGFQLFLSLFFVSSLMLKIFVFKRMSHSIALSLMVTFGYWLLVYDMNGIRQGLSIAIIGVAAYNAYHRKLKYFIFFTFLSALFHAEALLFLPFYFMLDWNLKKKYMVLTIIFLFVLSLFGFSEFLFSKILLGSVDNYFIDKVSSYSNNVVYNSNIILSFSTFHRLLIFGITVIGVDYLQVDKRLKTFFLTAAFMNVIIFLLLSRIELIAIRGSLVYRFIECIYFSYLPFIFHRQPFILIVAFLLYLYILLQIYLTITIPDGNLVPYRSILSQL